VKPALFNGGTEQQHGNIQPKQHRFRLPPTVPSTKKADKRHLGKIRCCQFRLGG
jgi:hypothetical protein